MSTQFYTFNEKKVNILKFGLALFGFVFLLSWPLNIVFAEDKMIDKQKIRKCIQERIKENYTLDLPYGELEYIFSFGSYKDLFIKRIESQLRRFESRDLIIVRRIQTDKSSKHKAKIISVYLSDEGNNSPHIVAEMDEKDRSDRLSKQRLLFITGANTVKKILKIEKQEDSFLNVYFLAEFMCNDFARRKNLFSKDDCDTKIKFKGSVKLKYDIFIEDYFFKGASWGFIGKENWYKWAWKDKEGNIKYGLQEE